MHRCIRTRVCNGSDSIGLFFTENVNLSSATGYFVGNTQNGVNSGGADSQVPNTYMSDLYVVENQILEPTAFGNFFEGKWGPLDSSVVIANIKPSAEEIDALYPPDQFDTTQNFAGYTSSASGCLTPQVINGRSTGGPSLAFDGNLETAAVTAGTKQPTNDGNPAVFSFKTPVPITTSFRIFLGDNGNLVENYTVSCGAASKTSTLSGPEGWLDVPELVGQTISESTL